MGSKEGFIYIRDGDSLKITDPATGISVELPTQVEIPDIDSIFLDEVEYINHHAAKLRTITRDARYSSFVPVVKLDPFGIGQNIGSCIQTLNSGRIAHMLPQLDSLPVKYKSGTRLLRPGESCALAIAANSIFKPIAMALTENEVDIDIMGIIGSVAGGIIHYKDSKHDIDVKMMVPSREALDQAIKSLNTQAILRKIYSQVPDFARDIISHIDIMTIVTHDSESGDVQRIKF